MTLSWSPLCARLLRHPDLLSAQQPPSYAKQVRPFLARYCLECHNAEEARGRPEPGDVQGPAGRRRPRARSSSPASRTTAGSSAWSRASRSRRCRRRRRGSRSREEVAVLRAWVAAGAQGRRRGRQGRRCRTSSRSGRSHAPVAALAYRPDGKLLAAGGTRRSRAPRPGQRATCVGKLPGQTATVTALAFSRDGAALGGRQRRAGERGRGPPVHGACRRLAGRSRHRPARPQRRDSRPGLQPRRQDCWPPAATTGSSSSGTWPTGKELRDAQGPQRRGLRRGLQPRRQAARLRRRPTGP